MAVRNPKSQAARPPAAATPSDAFMRRMLIAAGMVALLAGLYVVRHALVFIYLAVLLAAALSPAVRLVERWALRPFGRFRMPRTLAILVLYVAILGTVAGLVVAISRPLIAQAEQLWSALPGMLEHAEIFLVRHGVLDQRPSWQDVFAKAPSEAVLNNLAATGMGLVTGIFGGFALIVLTFYLLVESQQLFEDTLRLFAPERRPRLRHVATSITHKTSGWLGGHVLLGLIMGASAALVLGLLGVPYYYVLAVLSFVGEFFPYVGPLLSAVPGVLIATATSWTLGIEVAVFFFVQQQLENQVLVPKIFERRVGLSAVMVLVALLIGGELLGILGMILAVPSAAIVQVVLEEIVLEEPSR